MEKILVPTDLTETAELGLQLAVEIGRRSGAIISLVNFTQHPFGRTFAATGDISKVGDTEEDRYTLDLLRINQAKLQELVMKYAEPGVDIEYAIIDDKLKDGIDDYLDKELIDLVVMGTSGEESAEEVFIGNHTEQVISVSSCPVLSVRDGFNIDDLRTIVLAVSEITEDQVLLGLNTLRQLAECFDSRIEMVHINEKQDRSHRDLVNYIDQMAVTAGFQNYGVTVLEGSDAAVDVINFAKEKSAGLIAVIKNSKDGIFRIFSNNFSNRLVKEVGRPVFTYNLQRKLKQD